jgi:hypothetical protein
MTPRPEEATVPWFRATLVAVFMLVASGAALQPAAAGGPTSALLSVPGQGRTASLYYTEPAYDALADLVGVTSASGTGTDSSSADPGLSSPGVTITWLIHDVEPWRVDRVYPNPKGDPWIATQLAGESGSIWESSVVWHQAENGDRLLALLDDLGVGKAARAADDFSGVAGAAVPPPAEQSGSGPVSAKPAATASDGVAGGWWALAGLVVGVLATLTLPRLRRRIPRDAEPVAASDPPGGVRDELVWP